MPSTTSSPSAAGFTPQGERVAAHWARMSLTVDGAMEALRAKGIAPEEASAEDLHALDMNHMGGLAATDALAERAHIRPGQQVLDVGAGVGGPARRMARKNGAHVWGVELSEAVYQTAVALTTLVGLQDQVQFKQGSGLALPFDTEAFDVVVMQHVAMQIDEKDKLFGECVRVLKVDGVLALHELFAGEGGPPHFPMPFATEPAMSSLETLGACAARLTHLGLQVGPYINQSAEGRQFHEANIQMLRKILAQQEGMQGRAVETINARLQASLSMERNLREGRLQVGTFVCHRTHK